jgi:hypothetical protein
MHSDDLLLDHRWLAEHFEDYRRFAGEYIAVVKGAVVAHGPDVKQVYAEATRHRAQPLIAKVPQPQPTVTIIR